ncbi:MAG: 50S ribosomal protein L17 [Bacteroidales bacterium]
MRHLRVVNHLGRKSAHRKAMLANMASSLIMNKRITTTEAKAKALRIYVEPLITRSKEDTTHSRRVVFSYLRNKLAVAELFREVSPKVAERPGGYTRILKTGTRFGDNADMCIIELVDFNENMLSADDAKSKSTRRRRGTRKKGEEKPAAAAEVSVKKEDDATATAETSIEETVTEEETLVEEVEAPEAVTETEVVAEEEPDDAAQVEEGDKETDDAAQVEEAEEETDDSAQVEEGDEETEKEN